MSSLFALSGYMANLKSLIAKFKRPTPKEVAEGPKSASADKPDNSWWGILGGAKNPDDDVTAAEYREMIKRDPIIRAALNHRARARIAKGWSIVPGTGPRAEKIADEARAMLGSLEGNIPGLIAAMEDASVVGHAVIEKVPCIVEGGEYRGHVWFKKFAPRWAENFDYVTDDAGELIELHQNKYQGKSARKFTIDGEGDADGKISDFLLYRIGGERGNCYGESDLRAIRNAYLAKDFALRQLLMYVERFAGGALVIKIPATEVEKNLATAKQMVTDHRGSPGVVVPNDWEVDILYPQGGGQTQYIDAVNRCNAEILAGLGIPQTILSGTGDAGAGGSLALSQTHMETFQLGQDQRGRAEEDAFDEQILLQFAVWNYPNVAEDELPHFEFKEAREDDKELRARLFKEAMALGLELSRAQVRQVLDVDPPLVEEGEEEDESDVLKMSAARELFKWHADTGTVRVGQIWESLGYDTGDLPDPDMFLGEWQEKHGPLPMGRSTNPSGTDAPDATFSEVPACDHHVCTQYEEKLDVGKIEQGIEALVAAGTKADADQAAKLLEAVQAAASDILDAEGGE